MSGVLTLLPKILRQFTEVNTLDDSSQIEITLHRAQEAEFRLRIRELPQVPHGLLDERNDDV